MKENEYIIEISVPVRVCSLCGREIAPGYPYREVVIQRGQSPAYFHENCEQLIRLYADRIDGIVPDLAAGDLPATGRS